MPWRLGCSSPWRLTAAPGISLDSSYRQHLPRELRKPFCEKRGKAKHFQHLDPHSCRVRADPEPFPCPSQPGAPGHSRGTADRGLQHPAAAAERSRSGLRAGAAPERTWVPGHVPGHAVVAVEKLLPQELVAGHGAPLLADEPHREHVGVVQLSGKWFLVGMASRCNYLAEHSHQLEATTVTMTVLDGQSLAISTFRKLDRMCWEIRQHYLPAQAPGRFLLKGHRKSSKVDVVVGEADPSSFIILYYQKGRSISVKLYGRSSRVSDAVVDKFEQRARAVGLSQDVTYYFPTYAHREMVQHRPGLQL
uniref:Lipocalin/cytosolic fatty-acid binding domain-containing protein n=1 Tax=Junco hyemalis TaxID=40217 RepID=A0A8C5JM83_JUNHY